MILLVVFLASWQWGPGWLGIPAFILPPLSMVCDEALRMWQVNHLLLHTGVTMSEVVVGFLLGSLLGASFGYLLGMSRTAELALSPYILALQIAPKVAFAPLFILWMGFTVYPKILVAILIVFFPVMVNVLSAVRNVDPDLVNLARAFKAVRARKFSGRSNSRPRCRRCSLDCASVQRSPWSGSWWASWWAEMPDWAIC
jgi:NitT/TauT family transport system permease protein